MSQKLKLATAGAGYFSHFQYEAWSRIKEIEIVSICNRHTERAESIASLYGIQNIYSNIDDMLDAEKPHLVDIITPPETHTEYCKAAVDRGIPVICQKPFTSSLEEAEALVAYMEAHNGTIIIHENFRFQPWYEKIKDIIESRMLGDLYEIHFWLRPGDGQGVDAYLDRQPYFREARQFLIQETAVHIIDVFRFLFGEIDSLYADLVRINPVIKGEDAGIILFNFANGARGVFDGNRLSDHKAKNRRRTMGEMRIEGSAGVLNLNGDGVILFRAHGDNKDVPMTYHWADTAFGGDCVYRTQRHIIDHFTRGTPVMNTAKAYLRNQAIVAAAYKSSKTNKKIDLSKANS